MAKFYIGPSADHYPYPGPEIEAPTALAAVTAFAAAEGVAAGSVLSVSSNGTPLQFFVYAPTATEISPPPYV